MGERADDGTQEQTRTLKRRGLIAGAAALVAGMVAKQTAAPVAAAASMQFANTTAMVTNSASGQTVIIDSVGYSGTDSVFCGQALNGNSMCGIQGVSGLRGVPPFRCGVYGDVGTANSVGVFGNANSGAPSIGVFGRSEQDGIGVQGVTDAAGGTGVKGSSANGFPMIGVATGGGNGHPAVLGLGTAGPGVQGQSGAGHGLIGYTSATDGHAGLVGYGVVDGGVGLMGIAPGYGTASVGKAAVFYGNVHIQGVFTAPVQSMMVKHAADGSYRLLQSMASPEGWVEDFGEGTLVADKADIKLDPDFAALIHTDAYHVFLTAHGAQNLHVDQRTASGFGVVAMAWATQAGGPKRAEGGGTFAWRVVAKRKDSTAGRLAKVAPPTPPEVPTAFPIPGTPTVKAPEAQPPTTKP